MVEAKDNFDLRGCESSIEPSLQHKDGCTHDLLWAEHLNSYSRTFRDVLLNYQAYGAIER